MRGHHGFVVAPLFFMVLAVLFGLSLALLGLNILVFAYARAGIPASWLLTTLAASLLGSFVNVPVAQLETTSEPVFERVVTVFGVQYLVSRPLAPRRTTIAINVGGAVVPTVLSVYLVLHDHLVVLALAATAIVAIVVHLLARPVPGLGIAVPTLVPAIVAAVVALLLTTHDVAALAYVAGSIGVLVGADLTNLAKTRTLGAGMVSIGGAGTFDGIFVTGILAVVLAAL
jgi:uncharacterized membrane protein